MIALAASTMADGGSAIHESGVPKGKWYVNQGLWIFDGKTGYIIAGATDKNVKLKKGDVLFNPKIGFGSAALTDSTGKFVLEPGATASIDTNTADMMGIFVEQGEVEATEFNPPIRSAPRKRRQKTTKSVSVSPGGSKIVLARRRSGNWARFTVHKDLLSDIVRTTITCHEGVVAVSKIGSPSLVLKPGMSWTITE